MVARALLATIPTCFKDGAQVKLIRLCPSLVLERPGSSAASGGDAEVPVVQPRGCPSHLPPRK